MTLMHLRIHIILEILRILILVKHNNFWKIDIQSLAINFIPTNLDTFQKFLLVEIINYIIVIYIDGYFTSYSLFF